MTDEEFKQKVLGNFGTITQQLEAVNKRLDGHDAKFAEHDATLDRITVALTTKADKSEMDARFDATDAKLDRIYNLLDHFVSAQEIDRQERLAANHQIDRHDQWIHQLAANTHLRLNPEV